MSGLKTQQLGEVFSDWQSSLKTINDRGVSLFRTMNLSDCSFRIGPEGNQEVFKAHKLILSMASPVFEAMFYGPLAEKEYPIKITDIEPDTFCLLLEYIYTDFINANTCNKAVDLCYAAQKYMLPHVVEHCVRYIRSSLNVGNACSAYEFAKILDQPELKEASMQVSCYINTENITRKSICGEDTCQR